MLAEERFALILEQLNEQRTVTVQQLCEALHTSESTIRRDLTELDRRHVVRAACIFRQDIIAFLAVIV